MPAHAQGHEHGAPTSPTVGWGWTTDANVFFGYNYQARRFADLQAWESQNWFMLSAARKVKTGRLSIDLMASLEPWTTGRLVDIGSPAQRIDVGGSPQLFQTGESSLITTDGVERRTPLANVQHPHDLLMGLGATYRIERGQTAYLFGADLVGAATLGPVPFMHRESARDNPQVPLTHHFMDATHISAGVLRSGVTVRDVTFETSVFRGAEPDEHRTNIERPKLDSYAARVSWHRGPWQMQFSGGHLHEPEWFDPYDVTRWTASVGFNGELKARPFAMTAGWGQNREFNGFHNVENGYLLEWDWRATGSSSIYGRAENAAKQIFALDAHQKGFTHPHFNDDLNAFTAGLVQDLPVAGRARLGIGADVTVYKMSRGLQEYFGGSRSYHVFVRWHPGS